jgi:hypothetical protein
MTYHPVFENVLKLGKLGPLHLPLRHQSEEFLEIHLSTIVAVNDCDDFLDRFDTTVQPELDELIPQLLHVNDPAGVAID